MKAAQIKEYGHADVVEVVEIAKPTVTDGHVLIEVHASSINPFDTMVREGHLQQMIQLPVTLGGDISGMVVEVGNGVTTLMVGDTVYGQANAVVAGNSGAFAEYAVTKAEQVAKMPSGITLAEAASLPLVGASAVQALTQHIGLIAGQKLFIHGGAGGIGSIAIQIAKHIGAYVATTAADDGIEFVGRLGADKVIDYKQQKFADILSDYDAAFDTVGGEDFLTSLAILKRGGVAVSMTAHIDAAEASERGITVLTQSTHVTSEILNELTKLVESGVVSPQVGKVYPLAQVQQAFEARESGTVHGKIVLEIKD